MRKKVQFSDEFKELIEVRHTFATCFTRKCREMGVGLGAEFLKEQFKDLITPSGLHIATLRGHTSWVECLAIAGRKLYSGSEDRTIRIWDTDTYEHIATLRGHTNWVRCLAVVGSKLYSGSYDRTIRVWSLW